MDSDSVLASILSDAQQIAGAPRPQSSSVRSPTEGGARRERAAPAASTATRDFDRDVLQQRRAKRDVEWYKRQAAARAGERDEDAEEREEEDKLAALISATLALNPRMRRHVPPSLEKLGSRAAISSAKKRERQIDAGRRPARKKELKKPALGTSNGISSQRAAQQRSGRTSKAGVDSRAAQLLSIMKELEQMEKEEDVGSKPACTQGASSNASKGSGNSRDQSGYGWRRDERAEWGGTNDRGSGNALQARVYEPPPPRVTRSSDRRGVLRVRADKHCFFEKALWLSSWDYDETSSEEEEQSGGEDESGHEGARYPMYSGLGHTSSRPSAGVHGMLQLRVAGDSRCLFSTALNLCDWDYDDTDSEEEQEEGDAEGGALAAVEATSGEDVEKGWVVVQSRVAKPSPLRDVDIESSDGDLGGYDSRVQEEFGIKGAVLGGKEAESGTCQHHSKLLGSVKVARDGEGHSADDEELRRQSGRGVASGQRSAMTEAMEGTKCDIDHAVTSNDEGASVQATHVSECSATSSPTATSSAVGGGRGGERARILAGAMWSG